MSRVMEDAAATKQAGRAVGSPQWTAPEVLRGEAYNALADTYSFGMVLYEVRQSAQPLSRAHRAFAEMQNRKHNSQVMSQSLPYKEHEQNEVFCGVMTGVLRRPTLSEEQGALWPRALPILMARCLGEAARERPSFEQILDGLEPLLPAHCGSKPGAGI
jgi:serine/threonine protein kinase